MPGELGVSKHVVLCFLLGGIRIVSGMVNDGAKMLCNWDSNQSLRLIGRQPTVGFFVVSLRFHKWLHALFSCQNIRRNASGFAILKGEDVTAMPFSELMNEHHGMSFGNSSDQHMFFSKYVVRKKRHGAFLHTCRTFIHPLVKTSVGTHWRCGTHACMGADERCLHVDHQEALISVALPDGMGRLRKARKKSISLSTYLLSRMCWEYIVHNSWRNWCLGVAISRAQTSGRAAVSWIMLDS